MQNITIAAFAGSLREKSYNRLLIDAFKTHAPDHIKINIVPIDNIPLFIEDSELPQPPQAVQDFNTQLQHADGILISTPEYNNLMPGVLKNALDWASGGNHGNNVLEDKPLAITGATNGRFGTVRAQNQLLFLGAHINMKVWGKLRMPVAHAKDLFNNEGELTDEETIKRIQKFLDTFYSFITGAA